MGQVITNMTSNVQVTSGGDVIGDGTLDKLLATLNTHINQQYQLGRLTGTDYANVYLGGMQSALSTSLQIEQVELSKLPSVLK